MREYGSPVRTMTYQRKIRYSDTDAQGIVFNANYLRYLDDAVTDLFEAMGLTSAVLTSRGLDWVVGRTEIDHRSPARLGETLNTEVFVSGRGTTSFTIDGRIRETGGDRAVADTHQIHVVIDAETLRPAPVPSFVFEAIETFQGERVPERQR